MNTITSTLEQIRTNVISAFEKAERILILYEEGVHYIGDACIRFDKIRHFRSFFNNAAITLNFGHEQNDAIYTALTKNNPHLRYVGKRKWDDIDFLGYDLICSVMYDEEALLAFLHGKYGELFAEARCNLAVCSLSDFMLDQNNDSKFVFPVNDRLTGYCRDLRQGELYLSQEEKTRADQWLRSEGLGETEDLFVVLDSTSDRKKLMKITVYFELLSRLLDKNNIRVLIFDEGNIGKAEFYREWIDPQKMKKIIFSKGLSLRDNICLMTSSFTKLIFGPCTGLLHCASSVYNFHLNNGGDPTDIPLMVTYTGKYYNNTNAGYWWGDAPLVNCLLLKDGHNGKSLRILRDLTAEERILNDSLPCNQYSSDLLLDFLDKNLAVALCTGNRNKLA